MSNINFNKSFLLHSLGVWIMLLVMFYFTEQGVSEVGQGLYVRKSLACAIAAYITQILIQRKYFSLSNIQPLLLLIWYYLFAAYKCFVMHDGVSFEDEIFIGTYVAHTFMLAEYFVNRCIGKMKLHYFLDFVKLIYLLIPVVTAVHYTIYRFPITFEEMMAVYQTNSREAMEWWFNYMGYAGLVGIILLILLLFSMMRFIRYKTIPIVEESKSRSSGVIIFFMILAAYYPCKTISETDWIGWYTASINYVQEIKDYKSNSDNKFDRIQLKNPFMISDKPHTVIVVIGESSSRDYMRVFNDDYKYPNTPWMSENKDNKDFVFFNNAYSCHCMTFQVLENALTEKSLYNDKKFIDSMNFIDIAKKRGYKTYWITNLIGSGVASCYGVVSSRADVVYREAYPYDTDMLKFLDKLDPNENNFVVFHGNGSHVDYNTRYPAEAEIFLEDNVDAKYSNAVAYVDYFLKEIYNYSKDKLNLQLMVYYSDHGENMETAHAPGSKTYDKVHIPVFFYMGDEYQSANIEKYNKIKKNKDKYFTNDMMYNIVSDLINGESNYYNSKEDFLSDDYSFSKDNLLTFGGDRRVAEDPIFK